MDDDLLSTFRARLDQANLDPRIVWKAQVDRIWGSLIDLSPEQQQEIAGDLTEQLASDLITCLESGRWSEGLPLIHKFERDITDARTRSQQFAKTARQHNDWLRRQVEQVTQRNSRVQKEINEGVRVR